MKYVEELSHGECFKYNNNFFILTSDFKNNGTKLCYNLNNGRPLWIKDDCIIDVSPIYTLTPENNFAPIREYKSDNQSTNTLSWPWSDNQNTII